MRKSPVLLRGAAVAAMTAAALSGCAGDEKEESGNGGGAPSTMSWGLNDCDFVIAFVPVPADRIRPYLPEGFEPTIPEGIAGALPAVENAGGVFGFEAFRCRRGPGLDGNPVEDIDYGSLWATVQPPAELQHDVGLHFVKWDVVIPDAERREILAGEGIPAQDGEAEFNDAMTPSTSDFFGKLDVGGRAYDLEWQDAQPFEISTNFVEYTEAGEGLVQWFATLSFESGYAAQGDAVMPPDGFAREIVGGERAPAFLIVGKGGHFNDASIHMPTAE